MKYLIFILGLLLAACGQAPDDVITTNIDAPIIPQTPFTQPLPKSIFVIGDSISLGYTLYLMNATHCDGNANESAYGRNMIDTWLADNHYDIILFNFGLHDFRDAVHVPLPDYKANLVEIGTKIKLHANKVYFVSTTYVPIGEPHTTNPYDPSRYRKASEEAMTQLGIPIIDVLELSSTLPRLDPTNVHYTPAGYQALAAAITAALE